MTVFFIQMDSINYFEFECSLCFPDSVQFKKNVCIAAILKHVLQFLKQLVRFSSFSGLRRNIVAHRYTRILG
jgi:hypothetical protein